MPTSSIFRFVDISTPEAGKAFCEAWEKAEAHAKAHPFTYKPPKTLTREEIKHYFGGYIKNKE